MSLGFTFLFRVLNAPKLVTNLIPLPTFCKLWLDRTNDHALFKKSGDIIQKLFLSCYMFLRQGNFVDNKVEKGFCNRNSVLSLVPSRNRLLIGRRGRWLRNCLRTTLRIPKPSQFFKNSKAIKNSTKNSDKNSFKYVLNSRLLRLLNQCKNN